MSKLILKDAKTIEKLLFLLGFIKQRQKGSHTFYKHEDGRCTVIPFHSNKVISRPLMRKILNEINLDVEEYNNLIEKI
ncbi:type II toxin-antitoxin system HicA family toxin [Brachyspira innocens]|uniref:type II toxin-antitoxin system HicA family toxin n=1 Tax=Brachyspira innocens TaxID=13264 RepID=UPI0026EC95FF|nr:type II toxin-antitoxin system HicA family toxin [Brachyspira innocens]